MKKAKRKLASQRKLASPRHSNSVDEFIGKRMRELRHTLNISQADLGRELGVSFQQIQKYEKSINRVSAARLFDICKVLNVSIGSMFENDPRA
jgi:transcriptional regulator with XRE-family HTH domain